MPAVTPEILNKILTEYTEKGPLALANELGIDPKTVYRHAIKKGITCGRREKSEKVELQCPTCSKIFTRSKNYLLYDSKVRPGYDNVCSRACSAKRRETESLATKAYNLAVTGYSASEIAQIMNKPMGTISSWLNKKKFRRFTEDNKSYFSIKKALKALPHYKKCAICGFDRVVELAHIIRASKGGPLTEENTLPLCPNHHHLFDHNKLLPEEYEQIKEKVEKMYANKVTPTATTDVR